MVAVCGASQADAVEEGFAAEVGRLLAEHGCTVVCGGLGGVMRAVAGGVRAAGGVCVGLLPGDDAGAAAPELSVALPTGMGEMRNALIARVCAGMIAIGGGYGTLSEIAFALRLGKPVAAVGSWELAAPHGAEVAVHRAHSAEDAVEWLLRQLGGWPAA